MLLLQLRAEVLEANLELVRKGLVLYTFGNVSGVSREQGLIVIKPSGVPYDTMKPEHLVVTDMEGKIVEGDLRPSSDLATHLALYRAFPEIGGVAHSHSEYATAWAQARRPIPCFGTTHADYYHGSVPVTDPMADEEITGDYEMNTGHAIVRTLHKTGAAHVPGILVANHGPFAWGASAMKAAESAAILEYIARIACFTLSINGSSAAIGQALHDKHFLRKHGANSYYGQKKD
ncbi:L-ribulose 5-phosphate 4-epimerase [Candidatus Koribacter versatilis Ellin345]|uniref:L-ribulose-5-phosphate 4-epimerase n=1 Tax=Koribacter versatilis (strain Ellin345) TaxID=204669 RepID=Q1IUX0_KORVE|nr:L-ribulose-5-phosphate 4-epimerase [Candidatus Koribacter versatilis]ABF39330.1 L-ribulose 5-phosphate 4-epimerase [Candidatus Koribacter versatilis Ellin345]